MDRETIILQAGYRSHRDAGALVDGPQFAATYVAPGDPSQHSLTYGRYHNPTWTAWEEALGILEGGHAISFASGMAAVAAVFGVCLKPGDAVVLPADSYYTTRVLASTWLTTIGVQVRVAPTRDNAQAGAIEGARLLWIETPTNPQLEVCDIQELVLASRRHGVQVAVDNTTATAYLQQPLALGADYVVASEVVAQDASNDVRHVCTMTVFTVRLDGVICVLCWSSETRSSRFGRELAWEQTGGRGSACLQAVCRRAGLIERPHRFVEPAKGCVDVGAGLLERGQSPVGARR